MGDLEVGSPSHDPVMIVEVLETLPIRASSIVADGTLGLAGHAIKMIERIAPGGKFLGMDWDVTMLAAARSRLGSPRDVEIAIVHGDYRGLAQELRNREWKADGILLDLGLNSAQIEDPARGIAFKSEGPLDMRMDRSSGEPAAAFLNRASVDEIERVLWDLGDEKWARAIARKVVERRKEAPLKTTGDLVECVMAAIPSRARDKRIHPATRTFQAVRIAINRELEGLQEAVEEIAHELNLGGVLAVLSYHSGEDRAIKRAMKELAGKGFDDIYRKPRLPSAEEVARNPRSRSAKLRAARRAS